MNSPNTLPDDHPPGEDLLAYLDGELDADARHRLEEQLSTSGALRQRLKEYQQTWDLLDELPRTSVDSSFTRTTVELVAFRAEDAVSVFERDQRFRKNLVWGLGIAAVMATCAAGFFITSNFLSEPNERLVRDLPIIENLEAYRQAGSIDFLRQLDEQKIFGEDNGDAL